jgi:hypothetical protein
MKTIFFLSRKLKNWMSCLNRGKIWEWWSLEILEFLKIHQFQYKSKVKQENKTETKEKKTKKISLLHSYKKDSGVVSQMNLEGLDSVTYKPISNLVCGFKPPNSCHDNILQDLPSIFDIPEIPSIIKECSLVTESCLEHLPPNIPRLTFDEALVITAYSYDLRTEDVNRNLYFVLNDLLRERSNKDGKTQTIPHILDEWSFQAATMEAMVYCGVPNTAMQVIQEHYHQGRNIHWSAFTSTTNNIKKAKTFAQGKGRIIFRIKILIEGERWREIERTSLSTSTDPQHQHWRGHQPHLVVLVWDSLLKFTMGPDNHPVSPTEYVHNALSQQPGDVDKKNRYLSLLSPPSSSLSPSPPYPCLSSFLLNQLNSTERKSQTAFAAQTCLPLLHP